MLEPYRSDAPAPAQRQTSPQVLHKVSLILSGDSLASEAWPTRAAGESGASRSRWLGDRFSAEELQAMIDLYCSGAPAREVAETYSVSLRSVKRLLQKRGVRRRGI
jgi:hypothetical protein